MELSEGDTNLAKYISEELLDDLFAAAALSEKGKAKFRRMKVRNTERAAVFPNRGYMTFICVSAGECSERGHALLAATAGHGQHHARGAECAHCTRHGSPASD